MSFSSHYRPDPQFQALGDEFSDPVEPAAFPAATERFWNARWAGEIGLDRLDPAGREAHFCCFQPLPDNQAQPRAMRYHGHQFRTYNPELGDGRGFLFAQQRDRSGRLLDLATKGSGQTPWSRGGDGRLTLKGAVREILAAELLEARGVYTSKAFAVYETGEELARNDEPSPTRSAVLTRLGHSHLRFGTFQRHAHEGSAERVSQLIDHAITNYHPHLADAADAPAALLEAVIAASAKMAAGWMAAGFVHGVLNTDNLNITGESFDYGPWRFLPRFDPSFTAAYFDNGGRYAYGRQPEASLWAVCRLADCLVPFGGTETLEKVLADFYPRLEMRLQQNLCWRLGVEASEETGKHVGRSLFEAARGSETPFAQIIHDWYGGKQRRGRYDGAGWQEFAGRMAATTPLPQAGDPWFEREEAVWLPIELVESLWEPIAMHDDWAPLYARIDEIRELGARLRGEAP